MRLFSDSCNGQNKNFGMITTLKMIAKRLNVKFVYHFPVRGHSYMPEDRAFGRVEKMPRRIETILLPSGYYESFTKIGNLMIYPDDWRVYDFKGLSESTIRRPPSFKITESKIVEISAETSGFIV